MTSVTVDQQKIVPKETSNSAVRVDAEYMIDVLKKALTRFLASQYADRAGCTTTGPSNSRECEQYVYTFGKWLKIEHVELYKDYKLSQRNPEIDFDCLFAAVEEYFEEQESNDDKE